MREPAGERPRMPDYGVDDAADWQPLPWRWAAVKLESARNFWLITASATGQPHALPVWGVWDDAELRFCFSCGPRSRKARDIAANPQVAFAPEDTVECVSVEGRATALDEPGLERWIPQYLAKYQPLEPGLTADFLLRNPMIEVVPDVAFAIIERDAEFASRATRWRFAD